MSKSSLLVDLDSILDTRLATVCRIDSTVAEDIATHPAYLTRMSDRFSEIIPGFDDVKYAELYVKRDKETLMWASMTGMLFQLRMNAKDILNNAMRGVWSDDVTIKVNYYPYDLTQSEIRIIRDSILVYMPSPTVVEMVNIPLNKLSPTMVASYDLVIMYSPEDWLKVQTNQLLSNPIPSSQIVIPALINGRLPEQESDMLRYFPDPLAAKELGFKEWVDLVHVDIGVFSFNYEVYKKLMDHSDA